MSISVNTLLNIEKEESSRVLFFLVQSVFIGVFYGSLDVAAHALFLDVYPATFIPKAYIVSGLVGIVFTTLYTRLQEKIKFGLFAALNLITIALLAFAIWSGFWFVKDKIIVFILFIFFGPLNILAGLGFWGAVGRMFTLRQGKRIFGLIDSGQIVGIIISSYGATLILSLGYQTRDLLLISAGSIFAALLLQFIITSKFGFAVNERKDSEPVKEKSSFSKMIGNRYVLFMSFFVGFSVAATFFIHYTFVTVSKENYPDTTSLAKFLGAFTGTMMVVSLLVKTFVYGRLIKTYGLKVILVLSPFLLGLFTLASLLLGNLGGFAAASSGFMLFFLIISLTKLFSKILRDSVESPSFKVLYQSLSSDIRYSVQAGVDGTINEVAAFSSGLALALLVSLPFITTLHFVYILALILVFWVFIAFRLHREYRTSLQSSLAVYDRKIHSNENLSFPEQLSSLFTQGNDLTRNFVLSLAHRISPSFFEQHGNRNNPAPLKEEPARLVYSPDPVHRVSCAYYLRGQNNPEKIRLLRILLRDNEAVVRIAAIKTCGQDKLFELAPLVIEHLAHPTAYSWAYDAILSMGHEVLDPLEVYFKKTGLEEKVQLRIIRLMSEIGGAKASSLLLHKLNSYNRSLVQGSIRALRKMKPPLNEEEELLVTKTLLDYLSLMAWNTAARASLMEGEKLNLLKLVLEEESHRLYGLIMDLLALAYDEKSVMLVQENLETGTRESIGYALELLDLFLAQDLKRYVFPLLEDNSLPEKVRLLQEEYAVEKMSTPDLLRAIMNRNSNELDLVTRMMAIHSVAQLKNPQITDDLLAQLFNPCQALATTAALTIASIDPESLSSVFLRLRQSEKTELETNFLRISRNKSAPSVVSLVNTLRNTTEFSALGWHELMLLADRMAPALCNETSQQSLATILSERTRLCILVRGQYTEKFISGEACQWAQGTVFTPLRAHASVIESSELEPGSLLAILSEEDLAELVFDNPGLAMVLPALTLPTAQTSSIPTIS